MSRELIGLLIARVAGLIVLAASASAAREAIPYRWKNCTVVNKRFPHGVGKLRAHDRTKSGDPVTNVRHSTRLYLEAMHYNKRLDVLRVYAHLLPQSDVEAAQQVAETDRSLAPR